MRGISGKGGWVIISPRLSAPLVAYKSSHQCIIQISKSLFRDSLLIIRVMPASTTVLFVPGAWHSPDCFDAIVQTLEAANYATCKINLPSVNPPTHYLDFAADVAHIRAHIEAAADAGQSVVVVVHSYGTLPSNEAIKGLDIKSRREKGLNGGVTHLFFCCSSIIPEGQSLISAFGGNDLPWFMVSEDRLEVHPATPDEVFYNDCDDTQIKYAVAALRPHSYQTFHSPLERCPEHLPVLPPGYSDPINSAEDDG